MIQFSTKSVVLVLDSDVVLHHGVDLPEGILVLPLDVDINTSMCPLDLFKLG